jgi:hypothetical protein
MMILSHIHGPQAWRRSGYWKIAQSLGWQILEGRSMMILSHIHGPQEWRRSGYWMIAQSLGKQILEGRSMMILLHIHEIKPVGIYTC